MRRVSSPLIATPSRAVFTHGSAHVGRYDMAWISTTDMVMA
jgi:hypothetical protein